MTQSQSANAQAGTAPKAKKKMKVYQEEVKLRHTTHWDLDYMTTAELEALMGAGKNQPRSAAGAQNVSGRSAMLRNGGLVLLAVALIGGLVWVL